MITSRGGGGYPPPVGARVKGTASNVPRFATKHSPAQLDLKLVFAFLDTCLPNATTEK